MQAVSIKLDLPLLMDVDAIFINDCFKQINLKQEPVFFCVEIGNIVYSRSVKTEIFSISRTGW